MRVLIVIALVAILGWSIAALSITALWLSVLPLLSPEKATAPTTGEKPVGNVRMACSTCGAHRVFTTDLDYSR